MTGNGIHLSITTQNVNNLNYLLKYAELVTQLKQKIQQFAACKKHISKGIHGVKMKRWKMMFQENLI